MLRRIAIRLLRFVATVLASGLLAANDGANWPAPVLTNARWIRA